MGIYKFTQREIENLVVLFGAALREGGWKGVKLPLPLLLLCGTKVCE